MQVGPGPNSFEHFRETVELALICRADEKFTMNTLATWGELDDDEVILPDVIK